MESHHTSSARAVTRVTCALRNETGQRYKDQTSQPQSPKQLLRATPESPMALHALPLLQQGQQQPQQPALRVWAITFNTPGAFIPFH